MADKDKVEREGERLTEPDWLTGCTCAAHVVSAIRIDHGPLPAADRDQAAAAPVEVDAA